MVKFPLDHGIDPNKKFIGQSPCENALEHFELMSLGYILDLGRIHILGEILELLIRYGAHLNASFETSCHLIRYIPDLVLKNSWTGIVGGRQTQKYSPLRIIRTFFAEAKQSGDSFDSDHLYQRLSNFACVDPKDSGDCRKKWKEIGDTIQHVHIRPKDPRHDQEWLAAIKRTLQDAGERLAKMLFAKRAQEKKWHEGKLYYPTSCLDLMQLQQLKCCLSNRR
jgi:hypothetical protein